MLPVEYKEHHFVPAHYILEQSNLLLRGLYQLLKAGEIEQGIKPMLLSITF
jgi:hypothetical protein